MSRQGLRNFFAFTLEDTGQRQAVLEAARAQAQALVELIDGQLR